MSDKPWIIIVVAVCKVPYNLLRRSLDSLCAQTCDDFEAVLIDGDILIWDEYYTAVIPCVQRNGGDSEVYSAEAHGQDVLCAEKI